MTREYHEGYQQGYKDAKEESKEPTTKNDLEVREFEGIEVTYPPEEVCIYPEYKGKPYFAIKYKENGKEMVGYGTYNPEVLSQYLKGYFISTTKNDLGVDCINRATVLHLINDVKNSDGFKDYSQYEYLFDQVDMMPSVTPQEPFINKVCVSSGVCEHDKNKVLDKIRVEIETKYGQCDICEYDSDYCGWNQVGDIADILQIIDNYKVESE